MGMMLEIGQGNEGDGADALDVVMAARPCENSNWWGGGLDLVTTVMSAFLLSRILSRLASMPISKAQTTNNFNGYSRD